MAARLRAVCGEEATISRLGGDEFAVLHRAPYHQERGREVAAAITEVMGNPINYHQQQLPLTCSIGIARFPQDATNSADLQRFADVALYRSKAAGRSMWTAFDETMAAELRSRHGLEADLRSAITDGSIEPWYQPIVSSETGSIIGVEALARWRHPERGLLLPGLFIPIAEQSSLIIDLGRAMIDRSCREMQPLIRDGRLEYVSVNLSARHLRYHSVADDIAAALARHRFPSEGLQLEITGAYCSAISIRRKSGFCASRARHPNCSRRFWHRLFEPRLYQALAIGRHQDRSLLLQRHQRRSPGTRSDQSDHPARSSAQSRGCHGRCGNRKSSPQIDRLRL